MLHQISWCQQLSYVADWWLDKKHEATRFPPKRLLWFFVNMAESEEGGSPVEFWTAISLLREATNILSGLNNPTKTYTKSFF